MNVNFDLKGFLAFFKKTSFRISFLIGITIYKFWLLDTSNEIVNNIVSIIFVLSLVFLLDDMIERILSFIKRKTAVKKHIKELKNISDPQVLILVSHYFDYDKSKIEINPTSNFSMTDGEYQILQSKLIIFQASSTSFSPSFPFTIQEWAYNELVRAVESKEIEFKETKTQYVIKWYSRELKCDKDDIDDRRDYYDHMDYV